MEMVTTLTNVFISAMDDLAGYARPRSGPFINGVAQRPLGIAPDRGWCWHGHALGWQTNCAVILKKTVTLLAGVAHLETFPDVAPAA